MLFRITALLCFIHIKVVVVYLILLYKQYTAITLGNDNVEAKFHE